MKTPLAVLLSLIFFISAASIVHAQQCYVCDTNWRLSSGDGTCPKDKKPEDIPECKNSDEDSFGGCQGGEAVAGEKCGKPAEEDKLSTQGRGLFSPDNCAKLIPYGEAGIYGEAGTNVSDEGKCAESFEAISNPAGEIPLDKECKDAGVTNPLAALFKFFSDLLARLFKGGIGTVQTIYTAGSDAPTKCAGEQTPEEFNRGVEDLEDSLAPAM